LGTGVVAACAAAIVIAGIIMVGADFLGVPAWVNPSFASTTVGERRAIALEDGSLVQLNTATRVTVEFAPRERQVRLRSGEARFTVAKDSSRPFVVSTPQASVRALGTVFNVQAEASGTSVAVLQGEVQVAAAPAARGASSGTAAAASDAPERLDLSVGQRAAISPGGRITLGGGPPLERVRGWTEGRLVFRDETLAALVAEFNRYHEHPLRIADAGIAGTRVSGSFAADDLPSLIEFLERYERVQVRAAPDGSEWLERAAQH
jgi:transmembrane sensor